MPGFFTGLVGQTASDFGAETWLSEESMSHVQPIGQGDLMVHPPEWIKLHVEVKETLSLKR